MRLTMKRLFIVLVVLSKMVYAQILFTVDMQPDTVVEGELFSFTLYALEGDEQQLSFDGVLPSWLTLTDINVERTVGSVELAAGTGMASFIPQGLPATDVPLYYPQKSTILPNGEIVITDAHNHGVHKVGLDGLLFTIAGTGTPGFSGDGGPAIDAKVWTPFGITNDNDGNIYFTNRYRIRKIDTDGIITTFAGDGTPGYSGDSGPASSAKINMLYGDITVDDYGNIYFCDTDNFIVRKIDTDGIITTIAGNGTLGYSGDGGPATEAQISHGYGIDTDTEGDVYFMDGWPNHIIRKIDVSSGIISTIYETDSGIGLTVDDNMNFYYTNMSGDVVYKIDSEGSSSVIAGDGNCGFDGDGGDASQSVICRPHDVDIDDDGNIYITDLGNGRIRKIDTDNIINTIAGNGEIIAYDESGNPLETSFGWPNAVVLDDSSNYYIVDAGFSVIRMIHQSSGLIETIAGTIGAEWGSSPDGTPANEALIDAPVCLTFDDLGQLFFTEYWDYKVRYIGLDGNLYTYAGTGEEGNSGDNNSALNANLGHTYGIDFGPDGSLYFSSNLFINDNEGWSGKLKKVSPEGIITTLAGNGAISAYDLVDGIDASNSYFGGIITGVQTDQYGNIYFAGLYPHKIWMICLQAGQYYGVDADSGKIYSIAGVTDEYGYNGTEIPANTAQLNTPDQIYFDEFGQLYFTDWKNELLRKIDLDGIIYNIAGQPQQAGICEDGAPASESFFAGPAGLYVDDLGFNYVAENYGRVVSKIMPPSATITGIAQIDSSSNRDIAQTFTGVVYASNGVDTDSVVFEITVVPNDQTDIGQSSNLPMKFALHQNYPNPFNPVTTLRYDLPEDEMVNITIYDIIGRQVKTLVNGSQTVGYKSIQWNATNNAGQPVSVGVYLYSIEAGKFRQTKKMVLLK